MRIDEVRFDTYGEKTNQVFDFSRRPFYLAFGPNEAGKSSFLEFIRNLLFDLPSGTEKSGPFFSSFGESTLGGSATFRLQDGRSGRIQRNWKLGKPRRSGFDASLRSTDGSDETLDKDAFNRLLGGVDRRFFASYFGFSYRELAQGGELLKKTDLSELIYGFGVGDPKAFSATKSTLEDKVNKLFKDSSKSTKQRINAALIGLKKTDGDLKDASEARRDYSTLCKKRDSALKDAEEIRRRRQTVEAELQQRRDLSERRSYFDDAEEAKRDAEFFFAQTPFSRERLEAFPRDGIAEVRAISDSIRQLNSETEECNEELAQAQAQAARIERFPKFIAESAQILGASTRIGQIATERTSLPSDSEQADRDADELARRADEIGVDVATISRATISDAKLERAKREADDEQKFLQEEQTAKTIVCNRRDEIAELERKREEEETRRRDEFGDLNRVDDESDFDRVKEGFPTIRAAAEQAAKKRAALESRLDGEEKRARQLIQTAFAPISSSDDDGFAVDWNADALENAAVPLAATLDKLARERDEIEKKRTEARKENARLGAEIKQINERLKAEKDGNAASADELARSRSERDERWETIKADWLNVKKGAAKIPASERVATVDAFERAVDRADAIADSRFDNAKSIAEREAAKRDLAAKEKERAANAERLQDAEIAAGRVEEKARNVWRAAGLPVRSDFALSEAKEWRDKWEDWTESRRETRRLERELAAETARLQREARATAAVAARWLDDVGDTDDQNSVETEVANAKALLARAARRVEEWRDSKNREGGIAEQIAAAKENLRRAKLGVERAAEKRAEMEERRRDFLKELADSSILIADDAARSFDALASTLEKLRDLQKEARRIDAVREQIASRNQSLADFEKETAALATALGVAPPNLAKVRAEDVVDDWAARLRDAQDAEKDWEAATAATEKARATRDAKKNAEAKRKAQRQKLFKTVDAGSEAEFFELGNAAEEMRRVETERAATAKALRAAFVGQTDAEFEQSLKKLRSVDAAEVQEQIDELESQADEIAAEETEANARIDDIKHRILLLEQGEGAAKIAAKREDYASELREAVELYAPRLIALRTLERSLKRCEEEKRPQILEDANEIFARLTLGRYSQIVAENDAFEAIQRDGIVKSPEELSSGTREQLYLALRLAHIRQYCKNAEPLPLLTDDVLVNFDDDRTEETLSVLAEFAEEDARQAILLTCRDSTRRAFERVVGKESVVEFSGRKFNVENGAQ